MVTGGANLGRIGVIVNRERHPGSFDVVHVKDSSGTSFATRLSNIFVIGKVRGLRVGHNIKCVTGKWHSGDFHFIPGRTELMVQYLYTMVVRDMT